MGRDRARRLGVLAGSVLVAALAALPFAGSVGERIDDLGTTAGRPSTAAAPRNQQVAGPAVDLPPYLLAAPTPPADAEPPPPPPPPPPRPAGDRVPGVVSSDGAPVAVAVPVAPSAPAAAPDAPGRRVWAVVIGIDDYPGSAHDLRAAVADGSDLVAALLGFGVPFDQIRTVYDGAATIDGIVAAADWLVANAGPDDTAVFLYAGHVRDFGGGTEAVVTAENGWITDWFLASRLAGLQARDAWIVMAACYGGGFDELLAPGRVLTAGAAPGQLAYESDDFGRSYLAEYVFHRALVERAAEVPTVQAAVAYGMAQLEQDHPTRQVWSVDEAGHVISLDGIRRDGSLQPGAPSPPPTQPAPAPPRPDEGLLGGMCLRILGCD